jgi:hypothetical protein
LTMTVVREEGSVGCRKWCKARAFRRWLPRMSLAPRLDACYLQRGRFFLEFGQDGHNPRSRGSRVRKRSTVTVKSLRDAKVCSQRGQVVWDPMASFAADACRFPLWVQKSSRETSR